MKKSRDKTAKPEPVELDEKALGEVAGGTDPAGRTYVGTANGGVWKTTDGAAADTPDVLVTGAGVNAHVK